MDLALTPAVRPRVGRAWERSENTMPRARARGIGGFSDQSDRL